MNQSFLFLAATAFLIGCGSRLETLTEHKTTQPADPVLLFKSFYEKAMKSVNDLPEEVIASYDESNTWHKIGTRIKAVYDVKKTDSPGAPYVATITRTRTNLESKGFPTKEEAIQAIEFKSLGDSTGEYSYAFQNEKWVLKSYRFSSEQSGMVNVDLNGVTADDFGEEEKAFLP